jgi:excisionase family DNA binding protein
MSTMSVPAAPQPDHTDEGGRREYLTIDETARLLRCSVRTLQRLLEVGAGPPLIRISERRLIFPKADLRRWLEQRTIDRSGESSARRRGRPHVTAAAREAT